VIENTSSAMAAENRPRFRLFMFSPDWSILVDGVL
jgi:hypothetical protein